MGSSAGAGPGGRVDEVAGHGGTGCRGWHRTSARGQQWRVHRGRLFGGNPGAVDRERKDDPGRAAASTGPGADGGALPEPPPVPALRRATAAEGLPSPTADVAVRRRGGSGTPFRSLPMRRGVTPVSYTHLT